MSDRCRAAVVVLPGYTQRATPSTGLGKLYDRLECGPCRDRRTTWLGLRTWNGDHNATAAWLAARNPEIVLAVAYSYGAGWGLAKLAEALAEQGRKIDHAYLIDPVPRYRVMKPLSMTRWGTFKLPGNIASASYWRQVNDAPCGRAVEASEEGQIIRCCGVFGTVSNVVNRKHAIEKNAPEIYGPHFGHNTLDDLTGIHDAIVDDIERRIAA